MQNECSECGAKLTSGQNECVYCGATVTDANEKLLIELMTIARKFNEAWARGNRVEAEGHLADEYELRLLDDGSEILNGKKDVIQNMEARQDFVSYNIYDAELSEKEGDRATIQCVQSFNFLQKLFDEEISDTDCRRGTLSFIRRNGKWQIISENVVSVDQKGNEI